MNKLDAFKIVCYNCGRTLGITELNRPIEAEGHSVNRIIYHKSNIEMKFYCPECILLENNIIGIEEEADEV